MKINLLLAVLLFCGAVNAQTLKLKKGQKFSYEAIQRTDQKAEKYSSKEYEYWKTRFEVLSIKDGIYTLKASPELILKKWGVHHLFDSSLPFEKQPPEFIAIAGKVMTNTSYELKVDGKGNITAIGGVPEVRAAVMAKLKDLSTPEGYQKHQELADMIISDDYFKEHSSFFKRSEPSFVLDTTITKLSPEGALLSTTHRIFKAGLIAPSGDQLRKLSTPLMAEAKLKLDYANYYTPIKKAKRKIKELADQFNREKGSQTIEARIMKQLDSLDRGFAKDDNEYLGAKLGVLTYMGTGYWEILGKVPYEYLPGENDIDNKMTGDLERDDLSNVKKAVELSFTRFKGEGHFPLNMPNTSSSLHDNFGGLIHRMQNRDSLQLAFDIIKQIEGLNIPIVTEMFKGMKTYVRAKLATDPKELAEVADTHFSSAFDKAGRYRILIYDELVKKQVPDSVKLAYIDYTIDMDKKKIEQINSGAMEHVLPFIFKHYMVRDKIVYKKNLADAYYRKSKLNKATEASYLQMAADYLPSQQDIVDNQFGLKSEYKLTPFVSYTDLYLASGGTAGMTEEAKLEKYVDMVILEPERYSVLKERYVKAYPKGDFKAFFSAALKRKLPGVPKFSLTERSGKVIANKDQQNKFVFVDFWGTWCGACVSEIHKIEAVNLKNPSPEKLLVTTIACFDKKKNVDDFMAKEKYTYEVLMSDGKVEKDFKIVGYPTKLLLLPNGVYLTIPYLSGYEDILSRYLKWEI